MNTLVICAMLAALVTVAVGEMSAEKSQKLKACMDETHTTEADIKSFISNGMNLADAKDNIKCNIKCIMEKSGHFKAGVFDEAAALKTLKDLPQLKDNVTDVESALKECKNVKGSNDCDYAFKIFMCMKDHKLSNENLM